MATVNRRYLALEGGVPKLRESQGDEVIFTAIRIGGAGGKDITLVGGNFDFATGKLVNLGTPTSASDAATKAYVDDLVEAVSAGYDPKASVDLATAAALPAATYNNGTAGVGATLTANANGALEVDGTGTSVGDRILVKDQAAALQNGIYVVTAVGDGSNPFVLTRASDFDNSPENEISRGARTLVVDGVVEAGRSYFLYNSGTITVGTTGMNFSEAAGSSPVTSVAGKTGAVTLVAADVTDFDAEALAAAVQSGAITDGVTLAPTHDAVFDALAGKAGTSHTHTAADITDFDAEALAAAVQSGAITDGVTLAPTHDAVHGELALKANANNVKTLEELLPNGQGDTITVRQFCYFYDIDSMYLVDVTNNIGPWSQFRMVKDATIADTESGMFYTPGQIIGGFTGLTAEQPLYANRSTPGGYAQDLTGFVAGEAVIVIGYALSTTQIYFDPKFVIEF